MFHNRKITWRNVRLMWLGMKMRAHKCLSSLVGGDKQNMLFNKCVNKIGANGKFKFQDSEIEKQILGNYRRINYSYSIFSNSVALTPSTNQTCNNVFIEYVQGKDDRYIKDNFSSRFDCYLRIGINDKARMKLTLSDVITNDESRYIFMKFYTF